ncbi:MAG: anthranilate phosphoribosyltransferase [Planctomycetia bacterium]|nr:anthranilate phosphoribosyltransferase [Planctomycetia bacterium]
MPKNILQKLIVGHDLTTEETAAFFAELTSGTVSEAVAGAILAAMSIKGESVSELVGGAEILRRLATPIDTAGRSVVDIVGTGGDGGGTFNISTTAAFVAAGAGVPIAKHGNRASSGRCGSADVLEALGFRLDTLPGTMEDCLREHGIAFLFAQTLHPVMGKVARLRRELGVRTIFNLLGPLTNPAGARTAVIGVFKPILTETFARALRELGVRRAFVVHGNDGLDEISCCDTTRVAELRDGEIACYEIYPEMLLGECFEPHEILGGDADENAEILLGILEGRILGAKRAVVVANAAAACYAAGLVDAWGDAVRVANEAIDNGSAMQKLITLVEASGGVLRRGAGARKTS